MPLSAKCCDTAAWRKMGWNTRSTAVPPTLQRPPYCHRSQGLDLADDVGRDGERVHRRGWCTLRARSIWGRAATRPSRRSLRGAGRQSRGCPRRRRRTPMSRPTTWARSARAASHGQRGRLAAEDARAKLRALAAEAGLPEGTNYSAGRNIQEALRHAGRQCHRHGELRSELGEPPDPQTGQSDNVTPFWMVGGAAAEVEVDTETGRSAMCASCG